jgi:hypothetical protein
LYRYLDSNATELSSFYTFNIEKSTITHPLISLVIARLVNGKIVFTSLLEKDVLSPKTNVLDKSKILDSYVKFVSFETELER